MATAPVFFPPKNRFRMDGNRAICMGDEISKVTGTAMGGILGVSPWATPFTVACNLLGLAHEDLSSKDAIKVGIALEEKIIRYAGETWPTKGQFMTAEEVFEKRHGDHDAWRSDFEDADFGGHIDGIVTSPSGDDYILEIKTSSNMDSWADGVPEYYFWQVALYNHFLTKKDKAYVVLGIVNERTYRDPASWIPSRENVVMFEIHIDQAMVASRIEEVRQWYHTYITGTRTTPEGDPDDRRDAKYLTHLEYLCESVDSVRSDIERLSELTQEIYDHDSAIADLRIEEQMIKDRVKSYMVCAGLSSLDSSDGAYSVVMKSRETYKLAPELLVAAGLDPRDYSRKTQTNTLYCKQSKVKE